VCIELFGVETPKLVVGKAGGIVYENAHRRKPVSRGEYRLAASDIRKFRNGLHDTLRHGIIGVMHVADDRPPVGDQFGGNDGADTFPGSGDDGCSGLAHGSSFASPGLQ